MWRPFKSSRVAREIADVASSGDFSKRIETVPGGKLGAMVRQVNAILALAEQRDIELRRKLEELTDARDDAQTANQLMRRLKNELKARSAERDVALRRAEAANDAKSQFLANMSHEIRTPMHGILGLAEVLVRTNLEARQQALVHTIMRSGRGLLTIINDVLDFSKIESGNFDLLPRVFGLRSFVDDLAGPIMPRFEKKGIELIVRIDEDLPDALVGDSVRIRQVLTNLIENGLKFTDQGYVLLDIDGESTESSVDLVINVQDSGIGIPRDKIDNVFEKFNQVDNSSTRRHEGTGLGLAICRILIDWMKGKIEVASTVGNGSTFTVRLTLPIHEALKHGVPVRQPRQAVVSSEAANGSRSAPDANVVPLSGGLFQRATVLLVEDNPVNQEVAREYLGQMGCMVTLAVNGRESVARFSAESFDLILMDCLMPEMDGMQATRAIREIEGHLGRPRTPIVALTANAFEKDRDACIACGMDDFLSKPFSFEELEQIIANWLPQKEKDGKAAGSSFA